MYRVKIYRYISFNRHLPIFCSQGHYYRRIMHHHYQILPLLPLASSDRQPLALLGIYHRRSSIHHRTYIKLRLLYTYIPSSPGVAGYYLSYSSMSLM
jgi:hypothetical protein